MEFNSLNNITNKYPSGSRINPTASLSEAYTTDVDDNGNRIIVFSGASDENKVIINVESSSINLKDIKVVYEPKENYTTVDGRDVSVKNLLNSEGKISGNHYITIDEIKAGETKYFYLHLGI